MEYIGWFIFDFILIYIIYYLLFIRKTKRNYKVPSEVQYLITAYKLDVNKFSYYKFVRIVALSISLTISLIATIMTLVDGIAWQILFGFIAVIPVAVISFSLIGKYYQNKQLKDNSKELEIEKIYLGKLEEKEKKKKKKKTKSNTSKKGKKKNG